MDFIFVAPFSLPVCTYLAVVKFHHWFKGRRGTIGRQSTGGGNCFHHRSPYDLAVKIVFTARRLPYDPVVKIVLFITSNADPAVKTIFKR
jgi:hypothetical protein